MTLIVNKLAGIEAFLEAKLEFLVQEAQEGSAVLRVRLLDVQGEPLQDYGELRLETGGTLTQGGMFLKVVLSSATPQDLFDNMIPTFTVQGGQASKR